MYKEIIQLYNLFSIEICENVLTEMKDCEMEFSSYSSKREELEHYLDLRKGVLFC